MEQRRQETLAIVRALLANEHGSDGSLTPERITAVIAVARQIQEELERQLAN